MKKIVILALLTVLTAMVSARETAETPVSQAGISFDRTEHNFGIVPANGKKVSCTFEFTNTGKHPLVITRITTTCRCVDYKFTKKPVAPGEKGQITITYNPKKQEGVIYKVIQVFTNTADERHLLTLRGRVIQ